MQKRTLCAPVLLSAGPSQSSALKCGRCIALAARRELKLSRLFGARKAARQTNNLIFSQLAERKWSLKLVLASRRRPRKHTAHLIYIYTLKKSPKRLALGRPSHAADANRLTTPTKSAHESRESIVFPEGASQKERLLQFHPDAHLHCWPVPVERAHQLEEEEEEG